MSGDTGDTARPPSGEQVRPTSTDRPERPVLPDRSRDEQDIGWGDEPAERDDDWYRRERPPHHE
jgi:hypothetical protein